MRIGIDIGNVLIGGDGNDTTFFTDDYLKTPEVPGAWEALLRLKRNNEIHIISKCGVVVEEKSLKWLDASGFYYSLVPHRIHFVRKRHLKAPMAQALELDIFIDDRQDIIDSMDGIVQYPILFTSWEKVMEELEEIFELI
jgi:hypothetical protein